MQSEVQALTIASFCVFFAGMRTGARPNLDTRLCFLLTSMYYFPAFVVLVSSPISENYGLNHKAFISLVTLFLFGSAGEVVSKIIRRQ